jgi:hypothetical protein
VNPLAITRRDLCAIGGAMVLFVLHALSFHGWIVDDAGISFAYARNLARGYGLVSQPGVVPVEGYSNPLWVGLMAIFFALGVFDPVLTPKIVGTLLIAMSFAILYTTVAVLCAGRKSVSAVVLFCLALNTPLVLWTVSGLENPLYVLVLTSMLGLAVLPDRPPRREPMWFAVLAVCAALTRPDGIVYSLVYPVVAIVPGKGEHAPRRCAVGDIVRYACILAVNAMTLLAVRVVYFGDVLPNTYYAKGGPSVRNFLVPGQLGALVNGVTGFGGSIWLLCTLIATARLIRLRQIGWRHATLLLFLCLAAWVFLALPVDWLSNFRFGSPFFVFFVAYGLVTIRLCLEEVFSAVRRRDHAWLAISALAIAGSAFLGVERSTQAAEAPPIPLSAVEARNDRFDAYAAQLRIEHGSWLTPDVGAALYHSRFKIVDLGMLCDRTIARTLGKNPAAFYDYIFEEVRPTFIHTHDLWTALARFDDDPRFRRDYAAIREWTGDAWVVDRSGRRMLYSGDYVRRDAIRDRFGR